MLVKFTKGLSKVLGCIAGHKTTVYKKSGKYVFEIEYRLFGKLVHTEEVAVANLFK